MTIRRSAPGQDEDVAVEQDVADLRMPGARRLPTGSDAVAFNPGFVPGTGLARNAGPVLLEQLHCPHASGLGQLRLHQRRS
ncbi:hypothetical protein [Streptomyces sp. 5-10]|uniref:hypothetical protein n=1 Tax=Streptomyces sp. 5-10 TaxID=878925 RepID=UPI001CC2D847|nr:hypothetical protein [Streptomyces sp. 5-10]